MNSATHGNEDGRHGDEDGRHGNGMPESLKISLFSLLFFHILPFFSQIFDSPGV
nr:hypothetical protein [uncultured Parabacteroides sp.]